MPNNNGNRNGYHCPRCTDGALLNDGNDIACLACGWRLSFKNGHALMFYTRELVFSRLVNSREVWDDREFQDLTRQDWEFAGVANNQRTA